MNFTVLVETPLEITVATMGLKAPAKPAALLLEVLKSGAMKPVHRLFYRLKDGSRVEIVHEKGVYKKTAPVVEKKYE